MCAGYPTNQDFNYDVLVQLLRFFLNNIGDPFIGSSFSLNSHPFELCVLDWFAKLWEIEKNEYWGYVTNGGTEGNFHGILVGLVYAFDFFFFCYINNMISIT